MCISENVGRLFNNIFRVYLDHAENFHLFIKWLKASIENVKNDNFIPKGTVVRF